MGLNVAIPKKKSISEIMLKRKVYILSIFYLQAQPIDPELTAKLLGHGVAVSPVVTVEPRRRKFHKAITLSMPAPRAHSQGMINQYSGNAPTLRLLCSITGRSNCFDKNFLPWPVHFFLIFFSLRRWKSSLSI